MKSENVLKVLILEDNPYDAELNIKMLRKEEWLIEARISSDQESFRTQLLEFDPDIILSDYNLPVFNGMDALNLARKEKPLTPFIIVTGSLDEETAVDCIKQGAWDYVLKEHLVRLNSAVKYAMDLRAERDHRRQAEEKLIESVKLSSRLLDNIQIGVFLVDVDSVILFANKKSSQISGFQNDDLIGENVFKILDLRDIKGEAFNADNHPVEIVRQSKNEYHDLVCRFRLSNKNERWMNLCLSVDETIGGEVKQLILCFQDITEKLITDIALKESETRYESVFNSVSDGIFLYQADTFDLVVVNERVEELYGYTKAELKSLKITDLSATEEGYTGQKALDFAKKAIKGEDQHQEWLSRHKSGRLFWTRATLKRVMIGEKPFLMGIVTDIDKEKHAELSLRESEEHYRALSENSPDVIMRFDRNFRHLFVNNAIYDQMGLKPELFLNKTHHEMGIFDPLMCDFWEEQIRKVFETKAPHEVEFSIPTENTTYHYEWRLFPEFNSGNQVHTVLAVARDIRFKKQAEIDLRNSEERLKLALEATSDGIWDWDISNNKVYFSLRFFTMLGYPPDAFSHEMENLFKLIHPDEVDRYRSLIDDMTGDVKESIETEVRMLRYDNRYAWILSRAKVFPVRKSGEPRRMVGTHSDFTLRKRQTEIQNSIFEIGNAIVTTRNLKELFEKIQEVLGRIIDTKNCYIAFYDKKTEKITLPFHRDEKDKFLEFPAGKTMTAYVIRTGQAQLVSRERLDSLVEQGEVEAIGARSASWLGVPLQVDNEIIGVFAVQSYDEDILYGEEDVKILEFVSDQIALAISRKKDEDYIRENEQKHRRIIESSPDGLAVTSADGIILDHNTRILEMLIPGDSALKSCDIINFVNPDDTDKFRKLYHETSVSGYQKNREIRIRRADHSEFYGEVSMGLIQNSAIESDHFVVIIKDITDRIKYESDLKIAKEKAEESDRLKTSFLSNMSHEIRTPLNAIVGFAELLAQSNLADAERKEFISHINQGSETLLNLIDDIIDISKIEAGQVRVNNTIFRLSSLFNELHSLFIKNLKRQNREELYIMMDNCGFDPDISIVADSYRLRQILINLINNAVKFTEEGGIVFGIKNMDEAVITFYVKDTGIGIHKDKQHLIFDRFRQGHESKTRFYGGTGLGLAICKNLVELMGGDISVESELGKGSEFIFSISYQRSQLGSTAKTGSLVEQTPDWSGKVILIAEDETSNFLLLQDILKDTNCQVLWAKDGLEVVKMFKDTEQVDMILMDIRLPYKNGYEAAAEIKSINKDIPIITQTAYAMSGEQEKSQASGCDDYISKPLKPKDLLRIISRHMK